MKTKEDYKRAQLLVKKIVNAWDPCGLLQGGAPEDEFDPEINDIVRLLPRIKSPDEAIKVVSEVMTFWFAAENFSVEKCAAVGKELFDRCREEGLIGS
jgi:hypothetical protein